MNTNRMKHIDTHFHYTWGQINSGTIKRLYIPTLKNPSDRLTKPLSPCKHVPLLNLLGVRHAWRGWLSNQHIHQCLLKNHLDTQRGTWNNTETMNHIPEQLYLIPEHSMKQVHRLRAKRRCIYPALPPHQTPHPIQATTHLTQSPRTSIHHSTADTHVCTHSYTCLTWLKPIPTTGRHWLGWTTYKLHIFLSLFHSLTHCFSKLQSLLSPPKTCTRLHVQIGRHTPSHVLTVILHPSPATHQSVHYRPQHIQKSFYTSSVV